MHFPLFILLLLYFTLQYLSTVFMLFSGILSAVLTYFFIYIFYLYFSVGQNMSLLLG